MGLQTPARTEETAVLRRYKAWRRQSHADLLDGPHGLEVRALVAFLKGMGPRDGKALIARIDEATWLRTADDATRLAVLRLIGRAIAHMREKQGLDPWDDALWDRRAAAFQAARDLLRARLVRVAA